MSYLMQFNLEWLLISNVNKYTLTLENSYSTNSKMLSILSFILTHLIKKKCIVNLIKIQRKEKERREKERREKEGREKEGR